MVAPFFNGACPMRRLPVLLIFSMQNVVKPCGMILLAVSFTVHSGEQFDLSLLENNTPGIDNVDATWFNAGNDLLPGKYSLQVIINDEKIGTTDITLKSFHNKIQPLFTCSRLASWGVVTDECSDEALPLASYVPQSDVDIDLGENTLTITLPQKYWTKRNLNDVARTEDWDNGINAAFTNYALQYENQELTHTSGNSLLYGTFENGINLGGFQLRNNGFMTWQNNGKSGYTSSASFIRHDVDALRSTLTAGDFYTSGIFFSSLAMRGVSLTSDTDMFPSTERNYVPAVVGVAAGNATVVVRQKGYVIATRKVTPGPFNLKDIPASASAGDMEITVYEANGTQRTFWQPFNSSDMLAPAGVLRYYLYSGKNRAVDGYSDTMLEGNIQYGLNNTLTLEGGAQRAGNYSNIAAGMAANVRYIGAIYLLTNGSRQIDHYDQSTRTGQKVKLGYTKYIYPTSSYLYASLNHALSPGYREFDDVDSQGKMSGLFRNRYSLQFSQNIGVGNVVMNYSRQENWNGKASSAVRGSLNYTISRYTMIASLGRQKNSDGKNENVLSLNLSIPLTREMNHYLTLNHSDSSSGRREQLGASGTLLKDQQLSYNVNTVVRDNDKEFSTALAYLGTHGLGSGTFSSNSQGQQFSLGMEGGAVVHHHGVTFSQRLGSSAALIHTNRVAGLKIENIQNVETDRFGNAVDPSLVPYHYNEETLYNDGNNQNVEITSEVVSAAPRQGAIVEIDFAARYLHKQFIRIADAQNKPLPFGSTLADAKGKNVGIVSGGGIALIGADGLAWPLHVNGKQDTVLCLIQKPHQQSESVWRLQCK